jgi:hypothetical protein
MCLADTMKKNNIGGYMPLSDKDTTAGHHLSMF